MKTILFICTGNVFRSMCAQYCFNEYARKNNLHWKANSAGTFQKTQNYIDPFLKEVLLDFGMDVSSHTAKKLTLKVLKSADVAVAMAAPHKKYVKEKFSADIPLYNELLGKNGSVPDIEDEIDNHHEKREEVEKHLRKIVMYIHDTIQTIAKNL